MYQPPRFIRDQTGHYKLEVSLPGGRYQLSLDDRAVNVLMDDLGLETREIIPEEFVPFFVAIGDAWFPRERDTDSIIEDLRTGGSLNSTEEDALVSYVTESLIPDRNEERVKRVINQSSVADSIDPDDLNINDLPDIPKWSELAESKGETPTETHSQTDDGDVVAQPSEPAKQTKPTEALGVEELQDIPGIGPTRAERFAENGIMSIETIADSRPVELASIPGISEALGTVAVEGARELLGRKTPASERLSDQTGTIEDIFEPTIRALAAAGVPATDAVPTLRVLYGPTVADVDAVSGQQAFHLWEAGYQTPHDLVEASTAELEEVYQVGETTAPEIQASASELVTATQD